MFLVQRVTPKLFTANFTMGDQVVFFFCLGETSVVYDWGDFSGSRTNEPGGNLTCYLYSLYPYALAQL